jgi:putative resolvase
MTAGLAGAAFAADGRRLVVVDDGEVTGGLGRDMIAVLASLCAHRCGRGPVWGRALQAVGRARRAIGPRAVLQARDARCGGGG